jgi:hypothetical protein
VGVADNVTQLFSEHASIARCTEEVLMPRMSREELGEIIDKRLAQLSMKIEPDARWKIVILARGLPTYVHRLGKHAALRAIDDLRMTITEEDVDHSIDDILRGSLQSLRDKYEAATASNQPGNLFREILLACALARSDDAGYFTPAAVREPLEKILGRPMTIAQYQNHLGDWHTSKRGQILQRTGEPRSYRFRFAEPTMQPYILMRGIADGMVNDDAFATKLGGGALEIIALVLNLARGDLRDLDRATHRVGWPLLSAWTFRHGGAPISERSIPRGVHSPRGFRRSGA